MKKFVFACLMAGLMTCAAGAAQVNRTESRPEAGRKVMEVSLSCDCCMIRPLMGQYLDQLGNFWRRMLTA